MQVDVVGGQASHQEATHKEASIARWMVARLGAAVKAVVDIRGQTPQRYATSGWSGRLEARSPAHLARPLCLHQVGPYDPSFRHTQDVWSRLRY